jgi:thiol-disulfide isomerase/thioredoxin
MTMTPRRLITAAIAVAALAALAIFGLSSKSSADRRAPALPTQVLVGPRVTLASLRGQKVIVNFWASWCGPCRKEAPELKKLSQELPRGVRLVGVDWSDGESGAKGFIAKSGWTYPNLRDGSGDVGNGYRLRGMPTTFIVDARGRIAQQLTGPQTAAGLLAKL